MKLRLQSAELNQRGALFRFGDLHDDPNERELWRKFVDEFPLGRCVAYETLLDRLCHRRMLGKPNITGNGYQWPSLELTRSRGNTLLRFTQLTGGTITLELQHTERTWVLEFEGNEEAAERFAALERSYLTNFQLV